MNRGIVLLWTGVIFAPHPMAAIASRIHSGSEGVNASHARDGEAFTKGLSGPEAMMFPQKYS